MKGKTTSVDSAKITSELESGDPKALSGLSCYRNKEVVAWGFGLVSGETI